MTLKPPVGANAALDNKHIYDETTALPPRSGLAFVGAGVVAADDSVNDRTTVTISSSGVAPTGWFDVTAYGAIGNGTADDTTAVQNAINAAKTVDGGVVWLPPGIYKITSSLQLGSPNQNNSYHFMGAGSGRINDAGRGTVLRYTGGAGAGPLLACKSIAGVEMSHFSVEYAAGFDGDVIDVEGNSASADAVDFHIHHVTSMTTGARTARSIIRFWKAIIGQVDHCHLSGADYGVYFHNASYCVAITVADCTFNGSDLAHIGLLSPDGETIVIERCVFEAGTNTTGIDMAGSALYSPVIRDCWFGDSGAATTWINQPTTVNENYPGEISGCRFSSVSGGVHISGPRGTWLISNNSFENGSVFGSVPGGTGLILIANGGVNCTSWWTSAPVTWHAFGNSAGGTTPPMPDRTDDVIAGGIEFTSVAFTVPDPGIGGGAVWYDRGNRAMGFRSPSDSDAREMTFYAGTDGTAPRFALTGTTSRLLPPLDLPEQGSAPGAPAANNARLYAIDNGAGKTQLCVRFPTGAVQVIATEP